MGELFTVCKWCHEARAALDVLIGIDATDGVHFMAHVSTGEREEDQESGLVQSWEVHCTHCRGTGINLTPLGRRFGEQVNNVMKGRVIV